jgi:hypothetical protein
VHVAIRQEQRASNRHNVPAGAARMQPEREAASEHEEGATERMLIFIHIRTRSIK